MREVGAGQQVQGWHGLPVELDVRRRQGVAAVRFLRINVVIEPAALAERIADLQAGRIAHRRVEDNPALVLSIIADRGIEIEAPSMGRPAAMNADRPASRVLAVEDALRSAVDLDLGDVEGVDQLGGAGADHHIVDQQADRRILALFDIGVAKPANENGRGAGARGVQADKDVRRLSGKVQQSARLQGLDLALCDRSDRDRHVLQLLRGSPCGDDNFVADVGALHLGVGCGRKAGTGCGHSQGRDAAQQRNAKFRMIEH